VRSCQLHEPRPPRAVQSSMQITRSARVGLHLLGYRAQLIETYLRVSTIAQDRRDVKQQI